MDRLEINFDKIQIIDLLAKPSSEYFIIVRRVLKNQIIPALHKKSITVECSTIAYSQRTLIKHMKYKRKTIKIYLLPVSRFNKKNKIN